MKKFIKIVAVILVVLGKGKLLLTIVPAVDNDDESISTTNREYITL